MGTLQLRFAEKALAQPARARLREGGVDFQPLAMSTGTAMADAVGQIGQSLNRAVGQAEAARAKAEAEQQKLDEAQAKAASAIATQQARTQFRGAMADLETTAVTDEDPSQARRSFTEAAARAALTLEADLPEGARASFRAQAADMAMTRGLHIQTQGVQRQQALGLATLNDAVGGAAEDVAYARNPAERAEAEARANTAIEEGIAGGYLAPGRAEALRRRFPRDVERARVKGAIRLSPRAAADALTDPTQFAALDPEERAGLVREADQAADAEADQMVALDVATERQARESAAMTIRTAMTGYFGQAAGDKDVAGADKLARYADMLPPAVLDAARAVGLGGAAKADDADTLDALMLTAHAADPDGFESAAARAVASGKLTPGSMVRLIGTNRDATAETPEARAWQATRQDAADRLTPPDLGEIASGLPDLGQPRREALAEIDAWRAANPRAGISATRAEAAAIMDRHRGAMVDRLVAALPRPQGLDGMAAPYGPELIDEAEGQVLDALDDGALSAAEAGRRLRLLEVWRWAGEDVAPDEPGGGMGTPGRRKR